MKSKETLRKTILAKRKFIDPQDIQDKSAQITKTLTRLPILKKAQTILAYVAKPEEADTTALIHWAQKKGKTIYTPITTPNTTLQWTRLPNPYTLKNGPFGIPIPTQLDIALPPPDAPIIIPCIAFAENGHRIGHGAGYYDRYLARHHGPKILIALEAQHTPNFHPDPHDIKMDTIVTESNTYDITNSISN